MAELNSPELVLSCRRSVPGDIPFADSWFGTHGFVQCIPMSPSQIGLATSIFTIGGLFGSFYVGHLADKFGRKNTSLLHCFIYFIGSFINGMSNSFAWLLIGRFIVGLAAGSALVITSLYINEVAPVNAKGLLGSMNQVSINCGILFTQLLSLKWANDNQWRYLLFMASALGFVNLVLLYVYGLESPVWLANNGRSTEAFTVLHRIRGGSYSVATDEVNSWKNNHRGNITETDSGLENGPGNMAIDDSTKRIVTVKEYVTSPEFKNSRTVATGILVLQQFDGINSIIFYGVSVLVSIFPNHAIVINCLISLVNVVITFASATVVDRLGRKPLLLTSVSFLFISTILMGIGIMSTNSVLSIVGTFTYITFFAIGLGPIPFLLVGEVTQPIAKASAQSWGTSMNWVATFIVGYSFPVLIHKFGGSIYFLFSFMCLVSFWFIKQYIPETKGKDSYEQVWGGFIGSTNGYSSHVETEHY
ncbi:uncharacterized protein SPAPADRAFT_59778 [Spathaspora passalidarum NRRL Y-27907]|uniref:Major facilitator superfamily (MFS) profile domain-containing protein n=1 Tax=Spathaspora passalidarum (strain NRRL Y-27907 / 11-Y1) TaxID=619300 RepID=G3AI45_SPAPN|nr:uncharacterized protein SPAPADRAFT_59778 [Spathaspora passalidarum NRRL Y-27907]EGW34359.1 hypothetical protein SPAPADRAFT_59778 [Spathaspora passalidarum NRRL Y-27907]